MCSSSSEGNTEDDDVQMINIHEMMQVDRDRRSDDSEEELDDELPSMLRKQIRCANHTLNLVAAVDSRAARSDDKYKRMYDRSMGKVQALSNAVNKSVKHADVVEDVVEVTFLNPTCTRWSSEFSAVSRIVVVGLEKVRDCQQKIGLAPLTESEMSFLKGFVQVMKPFAVAMEFLQGEKDVYLGHVIPTVMGIQNKLCTMVVEASMTPLLNAVSAGLKTRFRPVFEDKHYHLASMLIPKFKLNYLPEAERRMKKLLLVQSVSLSAMDRQATTTTTSDHQASQMMSATDDDDLFAFVRHNASSESTTHVNTIDQEVELTHM